MKKNRLFFMFAALFVAAAVMFSCQKEEVLNADVQLKSGVVALDGHLECEGCIPEPYIEQFTTTSKNNLNYADVEVWNTNEYLYIKVTANATNTIDQLKLSYPFSYTISNAKNCNFNIDYTIEFDNEDVPFATHTFELDLPSDWNPCDKVEFALRVEGINGNPVILQGPNKTETFEYSQGGSTLEAECTNVPAGVEYILFEICEGCEESFSYKIDENNGSIVTFTYISDIAIEGAEVKLTCPHVDLDLEDDGTFIGNDGKVYAVNNRGAQTVLTWVGDILECEKISFDVTLTPDCDQNSSGKVNLWTDFKINEVSKKGVTPPDEGADCEMVWDEILNEEVEVCSWPIIKYNCN